MVSPGRWTELCLATSAAVVATVFAPAMRRWAEVVTVLPRRGEVLVAIMARWARSIEITARRRPRRPTIVSARRRIPIVAVRHAVEAWPTLRRTVTILIVVQRSEAIELVRIERGIAVVASRGAIVVADRVFVGRIDRHVRRDVGLRQEHV